jgi:hypothetical protein
VLGWIAIASRERTQTDGDGRQSSRCFPQFSLTMLLYLVTGMAIVFRVDMATAGTVLSDPAGGLTMWSLICGGISLHLWQRKKRRHKTQIGP